MSIYALSSLIASVYCFLIGFIALFKKHNTQVVLFSLVACGIAVWSSYSFLSQMCPVDLQLPIVQSVYAVACIVPTLFLAFVLSVLERPLWCRSIQGSLAASVFFILSLLSNRLIKAVHIINGASSLDVGLLYAFFVVFFSVVCGYPIWLLFQGARFAPPAQKNKLKYIFLSFLVAYVSGGLHFVSVYAHWEPVPHDVFLVIFATIFAYAVLKHRLMDISIVIRRTLIYSVVTGTLTLVYFSIVILLSHVLKGWMRSTTVLSYFAACVIAFLFYPVRSRVQRFIDKRFFRDAIDREKMLLELSDEITRQKTPEEMSQPLAQVFTDAFHPKRMVLYLRSPEKGTFHRVSSISPGFDDEMPVENPWTSYFSYYPQPLLQNLLSMHSGTSRAEVMETVAHAMRRLQIAAAFPLLSPRDLLGYLLIGEKKSEEPYNEEDLLLLRNAVNQMAMAYERYLLNKGLQEAPQTLQKMASSFVHEIKTPMANIKMPADVLKLLLADLASGKRSLDDVLPKLRNYVDYIREQTMAASDKVDAIRQMSKQQKEHFVPLMPGEVIRTSLATLDQIVRQSQVTLEMDVPEDLPAVLGDARQLGIVFMNLAKNGIEAMTQRGGCSSRCLKIAGRQDGEWVIVTVSDSGPGIEPEDMNRLFNAYFSTKGTTGTGMGLFLAQEVIKAHGGTIHVESEVGQGTVFVVRLPVHTLPSGGGTSV
ncbi:MAG: ATP-binding protein [Elusimicrobiota bacterium]|jgi:signal transduction histidine kinase